MIFIRLTLEFMNRILLKKKAYFIVILFKKKKFFLKLIKKYKTNFALLNLFLHLF